MEGADEKAGAAEAGRADVEGISFVFIFGYPRLSLNELGEA